MTYSIVARDPATGSLGIALESHFFGAGHIACWAEPGVGVIATQSIPEVSFGPTGLELLGAGASPHETLATMLDKDPGRDLRQVAVVDVEGRVAVHTGARCLGYAGHATGDGVSFQANMMANDRVWSAGLAAFEAADGDLAARLLAALHAAQEEGGDVRGQQAASIVVVAPTPVEQRWQGVLTEIHVSDHPRPVDELARLVELQRGVAQLGAIVIGGDLAVGDLPVSPDAGEVDAALAALDAAQAVFADNREPTFWKAVVLARVGRHAEARAALDEACSEHGGWAELFAQLPASGFLTADALAAVGTP